MAKIKNKKLKREKPELDSTYILKLTLYIIIGSQWVHFAKDANNTLFSMPIGALIGLIFAYREQRGIDRKIEFALLLGAMFIGYWLPIGITILI